MRVRRETLRVALVGVASPGYRSLALDYLQAAVAADPRLSGLAVTRIDLDTSCDPWWTAYRVLALDPLPDVVALPVYCWTARHVYEAVRVVKQAARGIVVVTGGPEVGPIAEDVLARHEGIDVVVRGEGEFAFCDVLHSLARGGDVSSVPGTVTRVGSEIRVAEVRADCVNLDDIPSPFQRDGHATDGSAYLETYRGCPHGCAYCYEGKGRTRIRSYSWERIAADIDAVASTPGMESFSFIDPVFNLTTERLERLAEILQPHARRGVRLHTIEVDIEQVDATQAALLARCGVVSVETGPQTVGARALATCGRPFDRERFAAGVRACREAGLSVECDLIVGLPGDTVDDVIQSIDYAIGLDPGTVQISTLHVLPGTALWERAGELGLVYDPEPPHELVATRDISYGELRRLEEFGRAAAGVYRARFRP